MISNSFNAFIYNFIKALVIYVLLWSIFHIPGGYHSLYYTDALKTWFCDNFLSYNS